MSAAMQCPSCKERFGGVGVYDRHFNRRKDACKTPKELWGLGFVRDADHVWHRPKIADQAPLIDKRRVPRTAQRTRRGRAVGRAGGSGASRGHEADPEAPRPAQEAAF